MLGVGWSEMLIIGLVALIVIGPKELPGLMRKIGKFAGTIRRMGSDFQRELNKTTGLDEVRNLRNSITAPLKATTDAIRKEFNTTAPNGTVQPSGALKPADPKAESVVNEIHAAAGIKAVQTPAEAMKDAITKATAEKPAVVAKAPAKRTKAATSSVVSTELEPVKPVPKKAAVKKPVDSPAPAEAIAPARKPAVKKPAAKPAAAEAPAKAPAKRKPPVKKA